MKRKKIKKMVKALAEEMRGYDGLNSNQRLSEYREERSGAASEKFKKMVVSLIRHCESLTIRAEDDRFCISAPDITQAMQKQSLVPTPIHEDNSLEITVDREGFTIALGWTKTSRYKDPDILGELLPQVKERQRQINLESFDGIWEVIMKKSGAIRGKNLDEIL